MIPSAREIIVQRHLMRGLLRLLSLPCFFVAVWNWSWWIAEGLMDQDLFVLGFYWDRIILGALAAVAGGLLLALNRLIVLWLIPLPRVGECPACGFPARGLSVPRCPECGLDLPVDLISSASERPGIAPPPVQPRDPGSGG